ncbi:Maf family protein [Corynebacterium pelargi]|uniref:Nucleoside triphosphate pyrophosphatase n=1 Tax=Corynebacterium pelargi TaxID=1471400 RepID=A0A410WAG0_9CORY|nr:nucleoside triphosphate pyrophosphatase [Corynebacterium pelargi]QAU52958.1 Maf-like protein YceF [Corynebacterium pelargi]GGG75790.1 Maf-like protein Cgl0705/cg0809 [Corynebacterium pelargi]
MRLVLASSSPSRRSILLSAGVDPVIAPANVDEDAIMHTLGSASASEVVQALATAKAEAIAPDFPDDVVLGCDSMLLLEGELQGKPKTVEATIKRWRQQRGKVATLLSGHHLITPDAHRSFVRETQVYFAQASDADIQAYAHSGEPLQCAGAFTLEAIGGWFIDRIEGDPSSVIGLSLPGLREAFYSLGFQASDFWHPNSGQ